MAQLFLGAAVPGLRPNKRHIATHDSSGKSVYAESPEQEFWGVPNVGGMARSYAVSGIPAQLRDDADLKAYRADEGVTSYSKRDIVVPGNGANVVVVDIAPGGVSGMHHTVSIDFSICVMGEIEHELDSGQKVKLLPGDHIVQRGTMHKWINASKTEPARFVAVTLACEPFEIPGKGMLEEWHDAPREQAPESKI